MLSQSNRPTNKVDIGTAFPAIQLFKWVSDEVCRYVALCSSRLETTWKKNKHKRASHETASLANAFLTDVLIVSAFCCRQTGNKIYSWVETLSLKTFSLKQYGWKIFSFKCGRVQDMNMKFCAGQFRSCFYFSGSPTIAHCMKTTVIQTERAWLLFCLSGALTLLQNIFSRHKIYAYKDSFAEVEHHVDDKNAHHAMLCHLCKLLPLAFVLRVDLIVH